jgi:hypothetical protein
MPRGGRSWSSDKVVTLTIEYITSVLSVSLLTQAFLNDLERVFRGELLCAGRLWPHSRL